MKKIRFEIHVDGKFYAFDHNYNVAANLVKSLISAGRRVEFYRVDGKMAARII